MQIEYPEFIGGTGFTRSAGNHSQNDLWIAAIRQIAEYKLFKSNKYLVDEEEREEQIETLLASWLRESLRSFNSSLLQRIGEYDFFQDISEPWYEILGFAGPACSWHTSDIIYSLELVIRSWREKSPLKILKCSMEIGSQLFWRGCATRRRSSKSEQLRNGKIESLSSGMGYRVGAICLLRIGLVAFFLPQCIHAVSVSSTLTKSNCRSTACGRMGPPMERYWKANFDSEECPQHGLRKSIWLMQYQYSDAEGNVL